MYVDDGILFACAEEWADVTKLLRARYTVCDEWLCRSGLAIEPDKTELLFFQKPYERNPLPAPTRLILPDREHSTYYVVRPVENLRYLGFFINRRLKWEPHVRIMCNRARASIKALQVLGNLIRGLSMANWRLVLNAVCLPVMSYRCQLWYLTHGVKGLTNMLQRVQNEMVRMVTGSFRTALRGDLLHIMRMLPMQHFIEKLTHTSALRLYRLPRDSQLLRRLGPDWHVPGHGDHPLVVTRPHAVHGRRNQRPTVLEALTSRVPSWGPRVDLKVIAPWEVPNWAAHIAYMGVVNPYIRKAWVRDLLVSYQGLSMLIIHTAAKLVTRVFEERVVVGGAAATFSVGGSAWTNSAWTIGSELTQFDADAAAIAKAIEEVVRFHLSSDSAPPSIIYLLSDNSSAIQAVKNPRSKKAHSYAVRFHNALTAFYLRFSGTTIVLTWAPADDELVGHNLACYIASEAAYGDPPNGLDRIQSAAFQKDRARRLAFANWERDYYLDRTLETFNLRWLGIHPNAAHSYTITTHPSENNHPLWKEATKTKVENDIVGRPVKRPLYRRHTTSTALQLAVDHAFTASYAIRFRPSDPPESLSCTCGNVLRTPYHIITSCPLHYRDRVNAGIHNHNGTLSLRALFSTRAGVAKLLSFLQTSSAASHPHHTGTIALARPSTPEGVG